MSSKQLWYGLLGIILLLLATFGGGVYLSNSMLLGKSADISKKRTQLATLEQQDVSLTKAKKDIAKYQELSNIARGIVPQDKDQAQTVREIVNIAAASGVELGSLTFPTSSLGTAASGTGSSGSSSSSSSSKSANNPGLSQLKPVKDIPGVYSLQIVVQSKTGSLPSYEKFSRFLSGLEQNRRTALVTTIQIQPDAQNPNLLGFTLTLEEYIKP